MLDLRNAQHIQDSRDLLRILKSEKQVNDVLDRSVFAGNNSEKLKKDILWRAQYVGQSVNFWELAKADLPWQISEGSHLNMNGPSEGVRTTKLENVSQSLARHAYYKDAYIARSPFRCFHRSDGFLLTMSPAAGVNYLNTNLPYYLNMSREELAESNFASVFAQVFKEFSETGTETWYRKDVEWFLVYLITEIGTTPHNIRQGYSVPSLMDAYDAIVHELGNVVGDPPHNENGETPADRIAFAQNRMEESLDQCKRLNADLRESLNSVRICSYKNLPDKSC
ncbi:hypothetical protein INS49_012684 [Diaporthe citri]|uniref:uncharacterized protein n=1 Tax=Diaporthe citri TaxID=83186 RepID=UPI001C811F0D|nr:uncharacterized protein INS49_012684 [Diaporthe citri]KAG6359164.1 hypothetical protein INS49_012684 [Diaporthe citri]